MLCNAHIILEDSWQADDVIEYCNQNDIGCTEMSYNELIQMKSLDFFRYVFMCNTIIVKYHLNELGLLHLIPDTYEETYHQLYSREIKKVKFSEVKSTSHGIFIKPTTNDKIFSGQIYYGVYGVYGVYDNVSFIGDLPDENDVVYSSEIVIFLSEYRILVGHGKVYGIGYMQGQTNVYPDDFIINKIIELTPLNFRCVDVGLTNKNKWIVVEINPPYSLDQYDIPLADYMQFVIDAASYLQNEIKNNLSQ